MQLRKGRVISPDADPVAWAKKIIGAHSTLPAQVDALTPIKDAAVVMIVAILKNAKPSTDRTTAIRKVRESVMFARDAINLEWED